MRRTSLDRVINPMLPIARGVRVNPVAVLIIGFLTYACVRAGWKWALGWAVFCLLSYVWPARGLYRAKRGYYSWMYPEIVVERLQKELAGDIAKLGLTEPQAEVLRYLCEHKHHHASDFELGFLLQGPGALPALTSSGREEREQAAQELRRRGWISGRFEFIFSLDIRYAAQQMRALGV